MIRYAFIVGVLGGWISTAAAAGPFACVPSSGFGAGSVTVIDTASDTVVATVPVGSFAQGAAVSPDGTRAYISRLSDTIEIIDAFTNAVVDTISFPGIPIAGVPQAGAFNPAGTRLYVPGGGTVSVVDTTTNTFITHISHASIDSPTGAVVTPDGSKVYVTNVFGTVAVTVIDTATDTVLTSIPLAGSRGIDVHPDGTRVYAADDRVSPNGVSVIDTATDTVITKVPVDGPGFLGPHGVRVRPDGSRVYAAGADFVAAIDTATNTVAANVNVPGQHFGLDITPDGAKLYVPDTSGGKVDVLDATTLGLITSVPVPAEVFARGRFIGPAFACGDGTSDPGEACDDGNTTDGDCCSSSCTLEVCDDGNPCTQDSCVAPGGCVFASPAGCRNASKSILVIKDKADDAKDQLVWKWIKGEATSAAEFADPTTTADYSLCVLAGTSAALVAAVPADGMKWTASGTKGYQYDDDTGTAAGAVKIKLSASNPGEDKAKILFKGKGTNLDDPPPLSTLVPPLTVQLSNDATAVCWQSVFQAADIVKQDDALLKAKILP